MPAARAAKPARSLLQVSGQDGEYAALLGFYRPEVPVIESEYPARVISIRTGEAHRVRVSDAELEIGVSLNQIRDALSIELRELSDLIHPERQVLEQHSFCGNARSGHHHVVDFSENEWRHDE
ncbi:MAG TPA: hypothetical protein VMC83_11720 [Streptosporangiaceae bacterium]|nr:hypothetical protein [Streptosporangiaceae bacterium]